MNNEQKAQRYDWISNEINRTQNQISRVEKRPLEEVFQDLNSVEYTPENQLKVDKLEGKILMLNKELRVLMTGI